MMKKSHATNKQSCGRDLPKRHADALEVLSDVYERGTRAKNLQADVHQCGRSMVEMLGVLAIIGVLSVGAIAGFHKAMFKYKLNKQAEQLNTVFHAAERYASAFYNLDNSESLIPYLIKLNEIPKEMIKSTTSNFIYDIFQTTLSCSIASKNVSTPNVIYLFLYPDLKNKSTDNLEMCMNIYKTIKENHASIYYAYSMSGYKTENQTYTSAFGDAYCTKSNTCLKDMTIETMNTLCSAHIGTSASDTGHITVLWKLQP